MMTHPLEIWLKSQGKTKNKFANETGISRQTIWRAINRDSSFSVEMLTKISDATGGAVSVSELLPIQKEDA